MRGVGVAYYATRVFTDLRTANALLRGVVLYAIVRTTSTGWAVRYTFVAGDVPLWRAVRYSFVMDYATLRRAVCYAFGRRRVA